MKIIYITRDLSVRGGTHKQLLRLCQYTEKQGVDFEILTMSYIPSKSYEEFKVYDNRIRVVEKKGGVFGNIRTHFAIASFVKKDKAEIVNIHDNGFHYAIIFSKLLGIRAKIYWQINDLPWCFRAGNNKGAKKRKKYIYYRALVRYAAKKVNNITVNVTKNKKLVKDKMYIDAILLYCGVDKNLINLDLLRKDISVSCVKLLSIGVLLPYRNYETLIDVVRILKEQNYNVELNIVGSTEFCPEYGHKIRELIRYNKLESNVNILGNIDEKQMKDLFSESDIFLFVNIDQSWGLAVFEAMANSLPVIVSNSVGAIELLENEKTALIRDPKKSSEIAKSVEKLVIDPLFRNDIIFNAKRAVSGMSWDKMYCSKLFELFNSDK
ncbi:MAG: glycosyltransferase family 4 protein [Bacteroidales bacterium]